jgi:hypothetical protein
MDPQIAQMDADEAIKRNGSADSADEARKRDVSADGADEARKRNGSADGADQDNICLDGDWIWWEV